MALPGWMCLVTITTIVTIIAIIIASMMAIIFTIISTSSGRCGCLDQKVASTYTNMRLS